MRVLIVAALLLTVHAAPPEHGKRYPRLAIKNGMIVDGNGTPASGPRDIVIENDRIVAGPARDGDVIIDAKGKYVLPGLINLHGHVQDERGGKPMPLEYNLNLWLACGITCVRDVGSDTPKTIKLRGQAVKGEAASPRLFVYPFFNRPGIHDADAAAARIKEIKEAGADGVKFLGTPRDVLTAGVQTALNLGLRVAHHAGVEETNAWDDIRLGTTSIEHWYGIPDAALKDGVQQFPASYNYYNETDRFRYAGRLFREVDPKKLTEVLQAMVKNNVAWDPTLVIYEAARDLQRAQTQPQFTDYLHPVLAEFFQPSEKNHGSFFFGWTSTDEAYWKENYRIWMAAVRDFERMGGTVGAGEDAGFIYQMYGFGLLRELELHQEAGFHPLQAIRHATGNNAKILGQERTLGCLRPGCAADVIVVNGNPLEDLKVLNPMRAPQGGIEWTIVGGITYHAPTAFAKVKELVTSARRSSGSVRR